MTILGIDPGYGRCGFGVIEVKRGKVKVKDVGVSTTRAGGEIGGRLAEIISDLEELIDHHKPTSVAIEKLYFTSNAKTAMHVAEARGAILLTCARKRCRVVEMTPGQVKVAVTGNGRADKKAVSQMVCRLCELKQTPQLDDASDALAIALAAVGFVQH
ncbi:crossover junction endodeoxyribonuclease RuvC [Candidatus Uhrbacteria bacterium]|nr:crossover junction endodeoxyribonuclease RuvC [Candidatus Uhrbacteria bacterium]